MEPPFKITSSILDFVASISEKLGVIRAENLTKPSPELRKRQRIKTIQASLAIEGNTLTEEQITALIEKKRIIGPKKDIAEVVNAISVYDQLDSYNPGSIKSFLSAHKALMIGLVERPGKLRNTGVGIAKGKEITHVAPPASQVPFLVKDLLHYAKTSKHHPLIKSSVVHYEIEFIHPFIDGNGRMGRLWQTLILSKFNEVFEYLPFETIIKNNQRKYYRVLNQCDKAGESTLFIEFILEVLGEALDELLLVRRPVITPELRINTFLKQSPLDEFSRAQYLDFHRDISTATASRDLKLGVEIGLLVRTGERRNAIYRRLARV